MLEENNNGLINLCKIRVMNNPDLNESCDLSQTTFCQSFMTKNWTSSVDLKPNKTQNSITKDRILEKVFTEIINQGIE